MDGQARINVILELKNKVKTGMGQAKTYLNKNISDIKDRLNNLNESTVKAFGSMADSVPGFGNAIGMLKSPITIVVAALTFLAGAYAHASQMAREFQSSMAKANVTAQESRADLELTSKAVLGIAAASKMANAVQAAPDAYNILLSAGLDKKTALDTLVPTLQAAKAGFTDVDVVARAAAAAMNSSGITDATRMYDILFATLNKGNAEFADIANYLPKIIPLAKSAGFNVEQVAGSFAFLTAQGLKSEAAGTGLINVFKALSDDSVINGAKGKLGLKGLGIDVFDAQGQAKELVDIIDQIREKTNGLTGAEKVKFFDQIGLDTEAASAIAMMTQNVAKLKDNIDFTTNSQGQLNMAIASSSEPMDSWVQASNALDVMWVNVGMRVNETLGALGEYLAPIISDMLPAVQEGFIKIWDYLLSIGATTRALIKPIIDWASKSELVKDVFSAIGKIVGAVWEVTSAVTDKLSWLYEHTIKPLLDGAEWLYSTYKSMLGLKDDTPAKAAGYSPAAAAAPDFFGGLANQAKSDFDKLSALKPAPTNLYEGGGNSQVKNLLKGLGDKEKKKSNASGGITGGQQTRIININKLSVVDGNFISNSPELASMNPRELERFFEEMLQRAMAGLVRSAT